MMTSSLMKMMQCDIEGGGATEMSRWCHNGRGGASQKQTTNDL